MKFSNALWHPRVEPKKGGLIGISALTADGWNPNMNLEALLVSIQTMLCFPGKLDQVTTRNELARKQLEEEDNTYEKQASSWAEEDNEGFGLVQFQDLRLLAIQSILAIPGVVGYKCQFYCRRESATTVKIVAVIFPDLTVYRDKVDQEYCSTMTRITDQNFEIPIDAEIAIGSRKMSRDRCWEISAKNTVFKKSQVDILDP